MRKFQIEVDGRKFQVEMDKPPTADDIEEIMQSVSNQNKPSQTPTPSSQTPTLSSQMPNYLSQGMAMAGLHTGAGHALDSRLELSKIEKTLDDNLQKYLLPGTRIVTGKQIGRAHV